MTSKLVAVALVAGLFSLLAGYELAARVFFPKLARDARLAAHSISSEQRYAAVISLAALHKLESGDVEKAKSLLAHEVIGYSRASFDASLPEREQIGPLIQAAIQKSPALKEELARERK
jgi:hypothetical protein